MDTPPLPDKKYSIIYADPPWWYSNVIRNRAKVHSGAYQHYPVMKTPEICALPIDQIAEENSLLFLWTTGALLADGIQVGKAWGFNYATVAFVWVKPKKPICGFYTMSQCEYCLAFRKGKIPQPRGLRNIRQVLVSKARRHAEKPAQVRQRITEMFPYHERIELFARQRAEGWDAWGNEVGKHQPQPQQQMLFSQDF